MKQYTFDMIKSWVDSDNFRLRMDYIYDKIHEAAIFRKNGVDLESYFYNLKEEEEKAICDELEANGFIVMYQFDKINPRGIDLRKEDVSPLAF